MDPVSTRIDAYRSLASSEARVYCRTHGLRGAAVEDAHADALLGLWYAARSYRSEGGASFGRHARRRIRGAILDGYRDRTHGRRAAPPTFVAMAERDPRAPETHLGTDGPDEIGAHYARLANMPGMTRRFAMLARGYSAASVARVCGVTETAICHMLSTARSALTLPTFTTYAEIRGA